MMPSERTDRPATGRDRGTDRELLAYLRERRWFGEKGAEIGAAAIVDAIPVQWSDAGPAYQVARARIEAGGEPVHYQLFLRAGDRRLDDALGDAEFRRGLVDAFAAGRTFEEGGARWVIQSESGAPLKVPSDARIRLATAEQSNSSIFVGEQAVLKMFRKVAPGVHPDLEVTRFLTVSRRFLHTPALLGSIHFIDSRGAWAAGLLQELVPGAMDAWSHALECSRDWFAETGDAAVPFVKEAGRLGEITREMHDTLASGDHGSGFERRDASVEDVSAWTDATVAMMRRALRSAKRDGETAAFERQIRSLGASIAEDAGSLIRIHGDYHLGQVLKSITNAFLVVDFEGEPARPLEERRLPHSPLRDVAGMLRSFAYAAAVNARDSAAGEEQRMARRDTWESATRDAFLRGYFAGSRAPQAGILPRARASADRIIQLFEIEKAFYELQYEIDHRPDWSWIPDAAIERLTARRSP